MTRRRDNRSDWETFSVKQQKAHASGAHMLHSGKCSTCNVPLGQAPEGGCSAVGCPLVKEDVKPRKRAVQIEHQHAQMLAARAARHWWWDHFTAIEHRTSSWREADQRSVAGVKTGLPDYLMLIPPRYVETSGKVVRRHPETLCALELKAPHHSPKRDPGPDWWLEPFADDAASRHQLRRDQHEWLVRMHHCGFRTCVAYGADQALAWLVEQAGPRPEKVRT